MSDVIPRPSPVHGVLPHAPPLHGGSHREQPSRCSNSSFSHSPHAPSRDGVALKRVRTDSHPSNTSPRNHAAVERNGSGACVSPQSDACAPSGGSHPENRAAFGFPGAGLVGAAGLSGVLAAAAAQEENASLPKLLAMFGEAIAENSTSNVGVFGQAILVASRLGAYCGAAWRLLQEAGSAPADGDKSTPLSRYCEALKLLLRQRIIQRVRELYPTAAVSEDSQRSLLQHVLLWQYLKHRNVMDLVTLAMTSPESAPPKADACFLVTLGVPMARWAIQQAKGCVMMTHHGTQATGKLVDSGGGEDVDMGAVLRMVFESAHMRSPSCTDAAVSALAEDEMPLHRVARFLSRHHALVTQILSGVDHTPNQLLVLYMALTHASALLLPDSAVSVHETPAVAAARADISAFNSSVESRQRAAKAAILDVRISAARSASWNRDVASCTVKAAVSQSFREVYLFAELKELLKSWQPMLDAVVESDLLPQDAAMDASSAAAAAFDLSPLGLRFRVPSAGFLLVWTTSPSSPAHGLLQRPGHGGAGGGGGLGGVTTSGSLTFRRMSSGVTHVGSGEEPGGDVGDILVQLGRPPTEDGDVGGGVSSGGHGGTLHSMGPPPDVDPHHGTSPGAAAARKLPEGSQAGVGDRVKGSGITSGAMGASGGGGGSVRSGRSSGGLDEVECAHSLKRERE